VTEPAPSGGPSPLRVGGLALLGAGAVAALIGLATLLPGGGSTTTPPATTPPPAPTAAPTAAPGATVAAPPAPSAPAAVPTVGPTAAVAGPPAAPAPAPAPAPAAPQAGTGGGNAAARGPVRVYNNSTVTGLAARAANDFRADGWQVGQVANYSSGNIPTSTVYYRPGTAEQSAASTIASEFGLRAEPRFSGIDDATPGLIVIVTNDYQKRK
jgi:LytR cell envelope-related transcriptional attenuator